MSNSTISIYPPIIAHRGASLVAPENTLVAFERAKELGANWVEFDAMLCADEVIVFHDETLERTTNGKGLVKDAPYRYLETLDAGSWFSSQFEGEKIPTLREAIGYLMQLSMGANIELKARKGSEALLVNQVLQIITEEWQTILTAPLLSSFSLTALEYIKKQNSHLPLGFLLPKWQDNWQSIMTGLNSDVLIADHQILDSARAQQIKDQGYTLLAYTVNDILQANLLYSWGVDAVFTDDISTVSSYS